MTATSAKPPDPAGLEGPREGTGQDQGELVAGEALGEPLRLLDPVLVQRDVGPARVPPARRPLRLAVADEEEPGRAVHEPVSRVVSGRSRSASDASKNGRGFQPKNPASRTAGTWAMRALWR